MSAVIAPTMRKALLALHAAADGSLPRHTGGFWATPGSDPISMRMARMMERDWLAEFDNPAFPSTLTLTRKGRDLVATLLPSTDAEAKAA